MHTAWFYGGPIGDGEKVVLESVLGKDVADLKDAFVAKMGTRMTFKLFQAVKGVGVASSWEKMGDALDVEMKLADVFGDLDMQRFFIIVGQPAMAAPQSSNPNGYSSTTR